LVEHQESTIYPQRIHQFFTQKFCGFSRIFRAAIAPPFFDPAMWRADDSSDFGERVSGCFDSNLHARRKCPIDSAANAIANQTLFLILFCSRFWKRGSKRFSLEMNSENYLPTSCQLQLASRVPRGDSTALDSGLRRNDVLKI
jgi:hypothetical protein